MTIRIKLTGFPNIDTIEVDTPEEAQEVLVRLGGASTAATTPRKEEESPEVSPPSEVRDLIAVLASAGRAGLTGREIAERLDVSTKALGPLFGKLNRWAAERYRLSSRQLVARDRRRVDGTRDYVVFSALHPSFRARLVESGELDAG